jgi:hypothetical protein
VKKRLPSKAWLLKRVNALFAEGKGEEAARLMVAYYFLRMKPERMTNLIVTSVMLYVGLRNGQVLAAKIGWVA